MLPALPPSAAEAAEVLLRAAPRLLTGDVRHAGAASVEVRAIFNAAPVSWLPPIDAALREADDPDWLALRPTVLGRPRPKGTQDALLRLGVSHPRPDLRAVCLHALDGEGSSLEFLLVRCDDDDEQIRAQAYAATERRLKAPGSAHAFVANLPLLVWLDTRATFLHEGLVEAVFDKFRTEGGRRALQAAYQGSRDPEIRQAALQLLNEA